MYFYECYEFYKIKIQSKIKSYVPYQCLPTPIVIFSTFCLTILSLPYQYCYKTRCKVYSISSFVSVTIALKKKKSIYMNYLILSTISCLK